MHHLLKPTEILRAQLSQEIRQVLEPGDASVPVRRVQILVPQSPNIFGVLTPDEGNIGPGVKNVGAAMGYNRNYKATPLLPGMTLTLHITPEQSLWLMTEDGTATVGLVVEYMGTAPNG
jgi:hypothetical protein